MLAGRLGSRGHRASLGVMNKIRVCLAGATGWAGSALARGMARSDDMELVAAVARSAAGNALGDALGVPQLMTPVYASASEALANHQCDVFVEYTKPGVAKSNVLAALEHGAHVVVGTSGLTDADYTEVDAAARAAGRGVLAVGNFALTVVLLQKFAEAASRLIPHWEIFDYAGAGKEDAPSGTARELAARLGAAGHNQPAVPVSQTVGERDARGATLGGAQVHSVRLPGYTVGVEVVLGLPDQRLSIRHDAGPSAEPYVDGALLAVRRVGKLVGVARGLDTVLEL